MLHYEVYYIAQEVPYSKKSINNECYKLKLMILAQEMLHIDKSFHTEHHVMKLMMLP